MDFKTFAAQYFNGDAEKALQHLASEGYYGDYSLTGSRDALQIILNTMTREEAKEYMRCFKETVKKDKASAEGKASTKGKDEKPNKWVLIFPVFFFILAIWLFITGCSNILKINELNKTGILVQVTVTDVEIDSSRENTAYYYTFTYQYNGEEFNFKDSPDREYEVGDTFTMQLDPDNPEVLVLPSSNLALAFLLLLFSGASVFLYERSGVLAKYIPHALTGWAVLMVVTGILLPNTTSCVLGSIFLAATLVIWMLVRKRKSAATYSSKR